MSNFVHNPVLVRDVLEALQPRPGAFCVDATVGGGGHAAAWLAASSPTGRLFGCDRDGDAIEAAGQRLAEFAGRFELRRGNFAELAHWLPAGSCDAVLLDLGVSSHQLDQAERGFSFLQDGPLDMRQDRRETGTAADLIQSAPAEELARIFWEFGEEPQARRIARALERQRQVERFTRTRQLADFIERMCPRRGARRHPATRIFQALRMAVNQEMESLKSGLEGAVAVLKPGGRLAVIAFHSLEDRMVKNFGNERSRDYTFEGERDVPELRQMRRPELRWVRRKALQADAAEVATNVRSRSAHLRVLEKVG